jgi:hypothetical protein
LDPADVGNAVVHDDDASSVVAAGFEEIGNGMGSSSIGWRVTRGFRDAGTRLRRRIAR